MVSAIMEDMVSAMIECAETDTRFDFGAGLSRCRNCDTFPHRNRGCGRCKARLCRSCYGAHACSCTRDITIERASAPKAFIQVSCRLLSGKELASLSVEHGTTGKELMSLLGPHVGPDQYIDKLVSPEGALVDAQDELSSFNARDDCLTLHAILARRTQLTIRAVEVSLAHRTSRMVADLAVDVESSSTPGEVWAKAFDKARSIYGDLLCSTVVSTLYAMRNGEVDDLLKETNDNSLLGDALSVWQDGDLFIKYFSWSGTILKQK